MKRLEQLKKEKQLLATEVRAAPLRDSIITAVSLQLPATRATDLPGES
jgi:hypothetical protein